MAINSKHPHYNERESQWARCRDTYDGEDAVKSKKHDYLPKLSRQSEDSYAAYVKRASFYNAIKRTIQGLTGAVMRIEPMVEGANDDWLDDITTTGVSLNNFIHYMLTEQLLCGRQGILVEHDGTRPYLTGYSTEQITNWMDDRIILMEKYRAVNPNDIYDSKYEIQYRELVMEDSTYSVNLWREEDGKWKLVEEIFPSNRGSGLGEIPFIALSVDGSNLSPESPPLLGLADINLSHYRTSADLEHGRHFTALPTPYVTGVDVDSELTIGAESAWVLPDSASRAGYLEFSGQGLGALEVAMEQKRSMMASLGAQLLEGQKNGVESSETLKLRQNSETSVLMRSVKAVEGALEDALNKMAEWNGGGQVTVTLNTDFSDTALNPQEMTALMGLWQSGAISHESLLWNMKRGEVLPPDTDIEEEIDRVDIQTGINPEAE
tara:strand:- start:998 stop:2305 length:1308 start_codon:yes stop_codon:yes gene_type:complete